MEILCAVNATNIRLLQGYGTWGLGP